MPWDNSLNPAKGKQFQELTATLLGHFYSVEFARDQPLPIGNPPKDHKFDLVSRDRQHIGECKNYAWTETGNVPSAKMGFTNEAAFYLSFLPADIHRFIVLRRDCHAKRKQTLAEYYYRTNRHLLGDIEIIEIDVESEAVRKITLVNTTPPGTPC